jgi:hypothetical protein
MFNPNASFYQLPKTGTFSYQPFAVGADYKFPDYFSSVFKPTQAQTQAKGTNTTTGGRDQPAFDYQSKDGAVPGFPSAAQQWIDFYNATSPTRQQERIQEALINQQITQQQFASTYPFLSKAAEEAAARNYDYSTRWENFKQQLPINLQNIAASQQTQAGAAARGEAENIIALSNLVNAQKTTPYRGSTFAVG